MQKPLTPPGAKQPPLDLFLKNLLRSGLLDRAQLDDAVRSAAASASPTRWRPTSSNSVG